MPKHRNPRTPREDHGSAMRDGLIATAQTVLGAIVREAVRWLLNREFGGHD